MYTMYMKQLDNGEEYTVAEFRANLRNVFEAADDMIDVFVVRHGKRYFLCTDDYLQELMKPDSGTGAKKPKVPERSPFPTIKSFNEKVAEPTITIPKLVKLCKNGHPLDKWGLRCSQKGCKYA